MEEQEEEQQLPVALGLGLLHRHGRAASLALPGLVPPALDLAAPTPASLSLFRPSWGLPFAAWLAVQAA